MISNFKLFPNVNISQNFVQNVQKQKNTFVLSWIDFHATQDRGPFCFWNILNEILQYIEIVNEFKV